MSLCFVGSIASPALYSGNVLGLNCRNRNTCLCGGREPVVLCTDECRDICKERGLPVDCVPCQWRCEYRNGIPLNNGHPRFIDFGQPERCCQGTDRVNVNPMGRPCNPEPDPCPTCFECFWECRYNPDKQKYRMEVAIDKENGLPCCSHTPGAINNFEKELCDRNNQKGKGKNNLEIIW